MKRFKIFLLLAFAFVFIQGVEAQIAKTPAAKLAYEIIQERESIPGETMGQKMESLLFWTLNEKTRRFPMMHNLFPSIKIEKGEAVYPLENGEWITPQWEDDTTINEYIQKNNVGGIIVLKDDKVRLESYAPGVKRNTLWTSFSVAKSISSMLLGVALKRGDIQSLDDSLYKYVPELEGKDYGNISVRNLLTMTSGIAWNEDYEDENSDVAQMYRLPCEGREAHIYTYMKDLPMIHKPGEVWNYNTGETDMLGILIQEATGKSLSQYLSETIWKPWGMEYNAFWLADECSDLNFGGHGMSVSLRDYARLGAIMLHEGKKEGLDLFAEEWMENAAALLYPVGDDHTGYGYLWWHHANGSYSATGIYGQTIYINPKLNLVIAQFAAWPRAGSQELSKARHDFIKAVENSF